MRLRNREGTAIDPVPYLVVASLAFLLSFSFGPVYCLSLGLSLPVSLVVSSLVFLVLATVAYHQMVWCARPDLQGEVPAADRLRRLFYLVLVVTLLLVVLSSPFLLDTPPEFGPGDVLWF